MNDANIIVNNIFSVNEKSFERVALEVFRYQYKNNRVYRNWVDLLKVNPDDVDHLKDIPFIPVSFFKSHRLITGVFDVQAVFESSGTTGANSSKHFVKDINIYRKSFIRGFELFYGDAKEWCIIGLLPSYLEREGSSLIMMVDELVRLSEHEKSGFYLYEFDQLAGVLKLLEEKQQKTLLIGVTFALLDFAEKFPLNLKHTVVMETGGMKGRKKEMVRAEIHEILKSNLGINTVHSEYGMTELLSQGYSDGDGIFKTVPWMKILIREEDDPLSIKHSGRGVINVIDLANIYSCSFLATDDMGTLFEDGRFEVLGRTDSSDVRGCSLMAV